VEVVRWWRGIAFAFVEGYGLWKEVVFVSRSFEA
jgi:hypothetical protein